MDGIGGGKRLYYGGKNAMTGCLTGYLAANPNPPCRPGPVPGSSQPAGNKVWTPE